jgi:hypothetical protein
MKIYKAVISPRKEEPWTPNWAKGMPVPYRYDTDSIFEFFASLEQWMKKQPMEFWLNISIKNGWERFEIIIEPRQIRLVGEKIKFFARNGSGVFMIYYSHYLPKIRKFVNSLPRHAASVASKDENYRLLPWKVKTIFYPSSLPLPLATEI